jgi:uncharacterized membrane protein
MYLGTVERYVAYGVGGMMCELAFTGVKAGWPKFKGKIPLWNFFIYSTGAIAAFEPLHLYLREKDYPLPLRVSLYACAFFAIEYAAGYLITKATGKAPWIYRKPYSIHGLIHLPYFPFWCVLGFAAEKTHLFLLSLNYSPFYK